MKNVNKRYEVRCLQINAQFVDEYLGKAQDEGWVICGDILITNDDKGHCLSNQLHIPMKREIRTNQKPTK